MTVLIVGTLTAVGRASRPFSVAATLFDSYFLQVVQFTVWQATLSTLISVILAIPVARAYARRPAFIGRGILITLMGLPVVMPVIVAVFGIVAVYGRSGLLNTVLQPAGLTLPLEIYGLTGILLAHTFFNLPLAVRLILPAWDQVTAENWCTASTGQYAGVSVVEIKLLTDQLLDGRALFFSQIVIRHRRLKEQRSGSQSRSILGAITVFLNLESVTEKFADCIDHAISNPRLPDPTKKRQQPCGCRFEFPAFSVEKVCRLIKPHLRRRHLDLGQIFEMHCVGYFPARFGVLRTFPPVYPVGCHRIIGKTSSCLLSRDGIR